MADYKGIKGFTIQNLSADPPAPILGQVWYNSTSNVLKARGAGDGVWASGGALDTARANMFGFGGSISDASVVGGSTPSASALNEQYDGSTWSEEADINTARSTESRTGAGTQTAGLIYGSGAVGNTTESWNGTSWAAATGYTTPRRASGGMGIQTAALNVGGRNPPVGDYALTEEYNGSTWSEEADINTARYLSIGMGTATSALLSDGYATGPGYVLINELYNGTAWTEVGNTNSHHSGGGGSEAGSNTASLVYGGSPPDTANTESWNGTSWTEVANLSTAVTRQGSAGSATSAISAGGTGILDTTEVWNDPGPATTVTFTSS